MFGISIIRKLPPALLVWLFYYVFPVLLVIRFLIGSLLGTLLFTIGIYWTLKAYADTKPYTFSQLVLWIVNLPIESKTLVITLIITIIGFYLHFIQLQQTGREKCLHV